MKIKDAEWCGDMGDAGAACFNTFSDGERDIPKAEWDVERFGMLCTKSENFANFKSAILKLCKQTKMCTYEDKQAIARVFKKFDAQIARVSALK